MEFDICDGCDCLKFEQETGMYCCEHYDGNECRNGERFSDKADYEVER